MNIRRAETPAAPVLPMPAPEARASEAAAAPAARASSFEGQDASAGATAAERLGQGRSGEHVALPTLSLGQERPAFASGPLELGSAEAKEAVSASLELLSRGARPSSAAEASQAYVPRSVEQDELGMKHVRLDRVHEGVKVFGDQVITHLDSSGKVVSLTGERSEIPAGLGRQEPKLSAEEAKAKALASFGGPTDSAPRVEKVIAQDAQGNYRLAYRVECDNFTSAERGPRRMNYLVDAQTGETIKSWNQMGGIDQAAIERAKRAEGDPPPPLKTVEASTQPNLPIGDNSRVESKIQIGEDFKAGTLSVDLDIGHTYRGDLVVSLTSPSGKTVVLSNREGGGEDDLKGSFDLSSDFEGEPVKGEWTLTVEDKANADVGTLKSWGLKAVEQDPNPPPPPPPAKDDQTLYAGKVQIDATRKGNGYVLNDKSRGDGVETRDAMNRGSASGSKEMRDENNVWGEATDDPRNAAGVDAQYGAQVTYDFYRDLLGRNSIDGRGEKLVSNVHINTDYVNAYWDGSQMHYGDGDGSTASALTTLDVAGHEITHGLTERTAGLIYSGESGGLNEAMSDIMSSAIEWYEMQRNPELKADPWRIGEQCWTPGTEGDALRYMDDPSKDDYSIDHYSKYPQQTEVHGSSGIANNAFYLLVQGGRNRTSGIEVQDGIGMEKGIKIFGRALINYMTPSTTFAQARQACLSAATDLYGADSAEVQKVKEAWTAVGVN